MVSTLEQLKKFTTIVADTGDFGLMDQFKPQDATTNPSLLLAASSLPKYQPIFDKVLSDVKSMDTLSDDEKLAEAQDQLYVAFGMEILKIVPGRVSIEVDARLSFDVEGSLAKARKLVKMFTDRNIPKERILIKLGTTWEGVVAGKALQEEGTNCNMTLIFSKYQAIAAAQVSKATIISPFVGRISDWFKANTDQKDFTRETDPGVKSVKGVYEYFKKFGIQTKIMGASFRNTDSILGLSGCDLLTIAPTLLGQLAEMKEEINEPILSEEKANASSVNKIEIDEKSFRWELNEDQMATDKLSEGVRKFAADQIKLEKLIAQKLQ